MVDEIEAYRQQINHHASLVHEKLWALQAKIIGQRINYLLVLQGIAPEKTNFSQMTPQQLRTAIRGYQDDLDRMLHRVS